jgi:hypothetical protein
LVVVTGVESSQILGPTQQAKRKAERIAEANGDDADFVL